MNPRRAVNEAARNNRSERRCPCIDDGESIMVEISQYRSHEQAAVGSVEIWPLCTNNPLLYAARRNRLPYAGHCAFFLRRCLRRKIAFSREKMHSLYRFLIVLVGASIP